MSSPLCKCKRVVALWADRLLASPLLRTIVLADLVATYEFNVQNYKKKNEKNGFSSFFFVFYTKKMSLARFCVGKTTVATTAWSSGDHCLVIW